MGLADGATAFPGRAREPSPAGEPMLAVDGRVPRPGRFTLARLRTLPRVDLGMTEVVCLSARQVVRAHQFAGVRLTELLAETGFTALPRPTLKQCIVVCHAADGYRAIFSWNELFNNPAGEKVLVVVQQDGVPVPGEQLSLIAASDLYGGPRNLRGLVRVETRELG